jgi:hypothetical protein
MSTPPALVLPRWRLPPAAPTLRTFLAQEPERAASTYRIACVLRAYIICARTLNTILALRSSNRVPADGQAPSDTSEVLPCWKGSRGRPTRTRRTPRSHRCDRHPRACQYDTITEVPRASGLELAPSCSIVEHTLSRVHNTPCCKCWLAVLVVDLVHAPSSCGTPSGS